MKMTIAFFKTTYDHTTVIGCNADGSCWADGHSDYLRVSDNIEVEFEERIPSIEMQLGKLAQQEADLLASHQLKLDGINKSRAQLLGEGAVAAAEGGAA